VFMLPVSIKVDKCSIGYRLLRNAVYCNIESDTGHELTLCPHRGGQEEKPFVSHPAITWSICELWAGR